MLTFVIYTGQIFHYNPRGNFPGLFRTQNFFTYGGSIMKLVQAALIGAAMSLASVPAIAGDAAAGEAAYNSKGCSGCHGQGGNSQVPANPALAGKDAAFLQQQMSDFKSGARKNPTMNAMAAMLSDADMANIAAYLSAQK